jgi:hypothetical protein
LIEGYDTELTGMLRKLGAKGGMWRLKGHEGRKGRNAECIPWGVPSATVHVRKFLQQK